MVEPNLQSIVITNVFGLVLLVGLLVTGYMARERRTLVDRMFTVMIFVCAGSCIAEPITWFVDGHPEPVAFALNYLGNTYCYLAMVFFSYFWVLYVDLRLHRGTNTIRRHYPVLLTACLIMGIAVLGNLFGHYLFVIDENNVYSRLPLSYLNYVLLFGMMFYSVWLKVKYQRDHRSVRFLPMSMFLIPIFVGSGLQAMMFGVSLAWPSVCIGLTCIQLSLQNELSYIDALTGLYNRAYIDAALKTMERGNWLKAGMMVDLDYFKDINDQYGHLVGDRALKQVADILTDCVPGDSEVVRMAGDEFVILLNMGEEERVKQVEESIRSRIDAFNASNVEPYTLSASIGSASFAPGVGAGENLLQLLDTRMYVDKRHRHAILKGGAGREERGGEAGEER